MMIVTGPSFTRETFISAPNFPVRTGRPKRCLELQNELLVEWLGDLGSRRVIERRAGAFADARMQRELADDENVAIDVIHGEIHLAGVIRRRCEG